MFTRVIKYDIIDIEKVKGITMTYIKKEKYKAVIVTSPSDKGIILAKYAKIKQIVGFRSNDKKIDAAVTHKISLDENIKIENIIEILSLLKL